MEEGGFFIKKTLIQAIFNYPFILYVNIFIYNFHLKEHDYSKTKFRHPEKYIEFKAFQEIYF